jgi:hypothetical protein
MFFHHYMVSKPSIKKNSLLEHLSDFWLTSGKVVTFISLIILPLMAAIYVYVTYEIVLTHCYVNEKSVLVCPFLGFMASLLVPVEVFVFFMIILLYPPYPFPYPIEWYFQKRGFMRAVNEFKLVTRVLYIVVPLLIVFTVFTIYIHNFWLPSTTSGVPSHNITVTKTTYTLAGIAGPSHNITVTKTTSTLVGIAGPSHNITATKTTSTLAGIHYQTFIFVNYLLLFIVIAGVLKIICALARSEFWLYFAIGCFVLMQDARNDVDEMKFFIMGLNSYNSYLRRRIKLQIKDLEKVYSKIAASTIEQKNNTIGKFALFFLPGKELDNTFYPLTEISKLLETTEIDLLVEEPLINRIRGWGAAAAVIIPVAIQLIGLFTRTPLIF